jgi:hypothetical protein
MLEDGVPVAGKDCKEVLRALDNVEDVSPFSPLYWLTHAHDLAGEQGCIGGARYLRCLW